MADRHGATVSQEKFNDLLAFNERISEMKQALHPGYMVKTRILAPDEESQRPKCKEVWYKVIKAYPHYVSIQDGSFRGSLEYSQIEEYKEA